MHSISVVLHQLHLRSPGVRSRRLETPGLRSPSCVLYEDVSGDPGDLQTPGEAPGEAPVIMVSAPTTAVLGPVQTLRAPQISFTQSAFSLE